jgi:hypothetical protein
MMPADNTIFMLRNIIILITITFYFSLVPSFFTMITNLSTMCCHEILNTRTEHGHYESSLNVGVHQGAEVYTGFGSET